MRKCLKRINFNKMSLEEIDFQNNKDKTTFILGDEIFQFKEFLIKTLVEKLSKKERHLMRVYIDPISVGWGSISKQITIEFEKNNEKQKTCIKEFYKEWNEIFSSKDEKIKREKRINCGYISDLEESDLQPKFLFH